MSVRFDLLLKKWKLKTKPMIQWTGEQNSFSVAETSTLSFDFQLKEELLKAQITNISRTEIKWYDDISVDNKTGSNYLTFLLNISNIHLILYLILFITLMTVINLLIACMIKRCCLGGDSPHLQLLPVLNMNLKKETDIFKIINFKCMKS